MPEPSTRSFTPGQALPFAVSRTQAEKAVLWLLTHKNRAMHVSDLSESLGMNERLVRQCVANLVEMGEPILSGSKGYFFPHTAEDVDRACEGYKKRALSLLRRIKRLKENTNYEELLGQLKLALEEK